jgi:hypothetical protein
MKHYQTREAWLLAAVEQMKPLFTKNGYTVPAVRVTCGWPSRSALSAKKRRIGECWDSAASTDGLHQIFISPCLGDNEDVGGSGPGGVQGTLATLVHEVVHAVVGIKNKHNKVFRKCAESVGLEGKMTATTASPFLMAEFAVWLTSLGEYPHAKLDMLKSPVKKQGTRLHKCECAECGYTVRVTQKWIDVGLPLCPQHGELQLDKQTDSDEDNGE